MSTKTIPQLDVNPGLLPAALIEVSQSGSSYKSTIQDALDLIIIANVGAGATIFRDETPANTFNLKSIIGGTGITATNNANDITISLTGGAGITSLNSDGTAAQIIAGTSNRITVGDAGATHTIDISSAYVGQATITTLGTIGTGTWQGTGIAYAFLNLTGAVLNADLAGSIAYSKLSLTGAILNADLAGSIAYSKLTLTGAILNADLAGSIAAAKLIGTDITTVGTITTGVWSSTDIAIAAGGTGESTAQAAINSLSAVSGATAGHVLTKVGSDAVWAAAAGGASPLTTKGDVYGYNTADARIPVGTNNHVFMADSVQTLGVKYALIANANIDGSAAIAYSKLNLTGAVLNADLAGSIAYSKLTLTGAVLNADLAGSIAYSKLTLTGAILNADLAGSIAYSKLSLTGAILNADLAGSIAASKLIGTDIVTVGTITTGVWTGTDIALANITTIATDRILGRNTASTGDIEVLTPTVVTAMLDAFTDALPGLATASGGGTTAFLRADGAWAVPPGTGGSSPLTTKGDLYGYDTGDERIPIGTDDFVLVADSAQGLGLKWAALVNANIAAGAAIAYSKLALTGAILNADLAGSIAYSKLSLTGAILNADLAGSIAASKLVGSDIVTVGTIATGVWNGTDIALANITDIATDRFLGRTTASTGVIEILTPTQATAMLNEFDDSLQGVVPPSGGGSTDYLRADGTWAVPPGTGGSSPLTTKGDIYGYNTGDARVPVGTNNHVLMADSVQTLGIKYALLANANIDGSAAIAYSKLNLTGAILNADLAGSIAYSKLTLTGAILNADLAGSITAAKLVGTDIVTVGTIGTGVWDATDIAFNKLTLTNNITNTHINSSAAIAYSKLNLTGAILNADLAGSITAAKLVGTDIVTVGTISTGVWAATDVAILHGGTGASTAQLAINALTAVAGATIGHVLTKSAGGDAVFEAPSGAASPLTTKGDIYTFTSVDARLGVGSDDTVLVADSGETTGLIYQLITTDNIDAAAAIAFSQLNTLASGNILVGSAGGVATSVAMSGDVFIIASGATTIQAGAVLDSMISSTFLKEIVEDTTPVLGADLQCGAFDLKDLTNIEFNTSGAGTPAGTETYISATPNGIIFNAPTGDVHQFLINGVQIARFLPSQWEMAENTKIQFDITDGTYIWSPSEDRLEVFVGLSAGLTLDEAATGEVSVIIGKLSALATSATNGFLYLPSMAGVPTGNSIDHTGKFPIVWDSTNAKLMVNTTGTTWVDVSASGASPLTTKGDLYGYNTADARIPVGADDTVLIADDTDATGLVYGLIANINIHASAAIAYSKLSLTGAILNADLAGSIAYSKLTLTGAILNADLAGSIATSKLSDSANFILKDQTNTFDDNLRQIFNPGATVAGLNVGEHAGDPSTPIDGDLWYNSSTDKFRARENGATVDLIGGGGGDTVIGTQQFFIPAGSFKANATSGAQGLTMREFGANLQNVEVMEFIDGVNSAASYTFAMPQNWDLGTIKFKFYWFREDDEATPETKTTEFQLQGVSLSNFGAIGGTAFGTAIGVVDTTDSSAAEDKVNISAQSAAVTIGGTPADFDMITLEIIRDDTPASGTAMTGSAFLVGIEIEYTIDSGISVG